MVSIVSCQQCGLSTFHLLPWGDVHVFLILGGGVELGQSALNGARSTARPAIPPVMIQIAAFGLRPSPLTLPPSNHHQSTGAAIGLYAPVAVDDEM